MLVDQNANHRPLDIVPVIDLKGGRVVHARRGNRGSYRPIRSRLVRSSQPLAVVEAFLALYPFRRLYVADLDALLGQGGQDTIVRQIRRRLPQLELWLDDAVDGAAGLRRRSLNPAGLPVVGSESLATPFPLHGCGARPFGGQPVLSLDFMGARLLGPARLASARPARSTLDRKSATSSEAMSSVQVPCRPRHAGIPLTSTTWCTPSTPRRMSTPA